MSTGGSFLPPEIMSQFQSQGNIAPVGPQFPTQNAQGGWHMPQAPAAPAPQPPAPLPVPPVPASSKPLSFAAPGYMSSPMMNGWGGMSGTVDASRGRAPGFDGMGWGFGGFGTADGSPGWGGLLGLGGYNGGVGYDLGLGADTGGGSAGAPGSADVGMGRW